MAEGMLRSELDEDNAVKQLDKENFMKPEKVKSRWRRNSEMETEESSSDLPKKSPESKSSSPKPEFVPPFEVLDENLYLFERKRTKRKKEVRRMLCECTVKPGEIGCGDECLNRLLMIECGSRCPTGEACSNRRFQKRLYPKTEPFKTEKKGYGLRVLEDVPAGSFVIEYVGEVLNITLFKQRVKQYAHEKEEHYYFMALKIDEIIDARYKANASRFVNHSCDPNCETQKWTVNGELRVGFFAKRDIKANEELTFDYQFERYGREAQKCYCGSKNCKGYIGITDEITVDIETRKENKHSKRKKSSEKERRDVLEDLMLEEEIEKLFKNNGLRNKEDTLMLARLMVRAEDSHSRERLLDIILATTEVACLRLFLDYHGLTLFWSWMVTHLNHKMKKKILTALSLLPVPNKTMLLDSKILSVVEKWASNLHNTKEKTFLNSFSDKEHEEVKLKSLSLCDTSDSETDGTSAARTSSDREPNLNLASSHDRTLFSDCDATMPKNASSADDSPENNASAQEFGDGKSYNASARSDEESGDTLDNESSEEGKSQANIEISNLAQNLLESWKDLKEIFRIPKREKRNEDGEYFESTTSKDANVKSQNMKDLTSKGSTNEKSPSFSTEEKPEEIKVVNTRSFDSISSFPRNRSKDGKHWSYSNKTKHQERRNSYSRYNGSSENSYSKSKKYHYSSSGSNSQQYLDSDMVQEGYNADWYDTMNSPSPALLPTPGTVPTMGMSSNNICITPSALPTHYPSNFSNYFGSNPASSPLLPTPGVELTMTTPPSNNNICVAPPLLPTPSTNPDMGTPHATCAGPPQAVSAAPVAMLPPSIMYPPPNNTFQIPFLSHPPPATASPVVHEHTAVPVPCPTSHIPPSSHLLSMPGISPPIINVQINTSSAEPAPYLQTQTEYCPEKPVAYMEPAFPFKEEQETYPVVQENGEPPKAVPYKLPPNWRTATDSEGNLYFYHIKTRETQWDPPTMEDGMDIDSTPTYDEPKEHKHESHNRRSHKKHSKRKSTTTAPADTSSRDVVNGEIAKKIKELFRTKMSTFVVSCLNPYRKDDCKVGRITSNEDFKHLARKLTHFVMAKELKHCKNVEDLDANESVKLKAKDYIRKYMDRYGPVYRKEKIVSTGEDR